MKKMILAGMVALAICVGAITAKVIFQSDETQSESENRNRAEIGEASITPAGSPAGDSAMREASMIAADSLVDDPVNESAADPKARTLRIGVEKGAALNFHVERSHQRTGRFEGGDESEITYALKVKEVNDDGSFDLEVEVDRIRFVRTGRAPLTFDSAEESKGESVLLAGLRDYVDHPFLVSMDPQGTVGKVEGFPQSGVRLNWPTDDPDRLSPSMQNAADRMYSGSKTNFQGSKREAYLQRMFSLVVKFIMSPDIIRADLHTIFAAGLQGEKLESGTMYHVDVPERDGTRGRRIHHPGPVPIYDQDGNLVQGEENENPLYGQGGRKGRGQYAMRFVPLEGRIRPFDFFEFALIQTYSPTDTDGPEVGTASYRKSDGLIEKLAYRYEMENESSRDPYWMSWKINIS